MEGWDSCDVVEGEKGDEDRKGGHCGLKLGRHGRVVWKESREDPVVYRLCRARQRWPQRLDPPVGSPLAREAIGASPGLQSTLKVAMGG